MLEASPLTGKTSQRLNTLPQEPFFLQGGVRENMTLFDFALTSASSGTLCNVRLLDMLKNRGGLDRALSEKALSHGQR